MYRILLMFPRSADAALVDSLVTEVTAAFKKSPGTLNLTHSVGGLMGPGGKAGEIGRIVEADVAAIDDAMAVLQNPDFQSVKEQTESLGTTIFMYELGEA